MSSKILTAFIAVFLCATAYGQNAAENNLQFAEFKEIPQFVEQDDSVEKTKFEDFKEIKPLTPENFTKTKSSQSSNEQNTNAQTNDDYVRPTKKERFKRYVNSTVGWRVFAKSAARATFSTIGNRPEEWGKDGEGFARRFASSLGTNAIKQTTIYGLDEALKLDSRYYKSKKKDFGSRFKNAMLSTVTARNKNGKRVVGVPRIVGTYSAAVISREVWYPERFDYKDGLRSGTISLGFTAAFNLIREYF